MHSATGFALYVFLHMLLSLRCWCFVSRKILITQSVQKGSQLSALTFESDGEQATFGQQAAGLRGMKSFRAQALRYGTLCHLEQGTLGHTLGPQATATPCEAKQ